MKRYDISNGDADNFPYVAVMLERADGANSALANPQAGAPKHKATVEGMGHGRSCSALFCQRCFIARTKDEHWAFVGDAHDFEPGQGDCRKCDALREIEEIINGN